MFAFRCGVDDEECCWAVLVVFLGVVSSKQAPPPTRNMFAGHSPPIPLPAVRAPCAPSMRVDWMSTIVTLGLSTIDVTTLAPMSRLCVITVPLAPRLYEFLTRTLKRPDLIAGCMASGCSTCAPKYASSVASSS